MAFGRQLTMRCFHCNKRLAPGYIEVDFHGVQVKLHKCCKEAHDKVWRQVSAAPREEQEPPQE